MPGPATPAAPPATASPFQSDNRSWQGYLKEATRAYAPTLQGITDEAAREKAVQEERDARLALQTKIVTFISLATGIVSALMFLLNLFAPLLRNLFNLPSP